MQENRKENIMGTQPIGRLLPTMAFPIMLSMIVQALYNVVDSIFVSMVSENALTSVSLVFPVQNLIIAVSVGTAVGINALLSRRLGEKNYEAANKVANNGVSVTILTWLVFAAVGALFSTTFMSLCGAEGQVAADGALYMRIVTIFSLGALVEITMERILQVTGKTVYQMISQMSGAVVNIILDPIMIFGLLGFPAMGVAGAAVATVTGQLFAMVVSLLLNHFKNHEVRLSAKGMLHLEGRTIRGIYQVGLPSIIMQSIGSVMTFGMNKILIVFSQTAVSVFGVYFKLQSFVFMPVFGVTNALVPIVGYNYGARQKKRIIDAVKLALVMALAIMAAGLAVFQLLPVQLLGLFSASENMLEIGVPALRIISLCFPLAGVGVVLSCVFQALGDGMLSLWMSAVRQLLLLLPAAWVLARLGGLHTVWFAFIFAEGFGFLLALAFYRHIYRTKISRLEEIKFD